ncbi:hypothetical protein ICN10_01560 [Polynucleobacter sp. 86C-FISCH]|uniref:hypothetical protein n=1 Tax=Polynucleobacter sp. 86C-FISCH TaxID=2689101 RepID=UPI001C0CDAC8|nr:hypothetical protein [Polynucleobacter sp. 86C-FISCH]MBU3595083.1 hypothetical protein [Polynucleobacter sp. 86C-FISCH]
MEKQNDDDQIQLTPEEHARQTRSWQAGDIALVKLSVAMRKAREAKTNRELARARISIQETLIRGMIAEGAQWAVVLEHLEKAMPEIPSGDLFKALEALRKRILRERQKTEEELEQKPPGTITQKPKSEPLRDPKTIDFINGRSDDPRKEPDKPALMGEGTVAGGSDRQPGESTADYELRKSLEPDPKGRQRFIGEH